MGVCWRRFMSQPAAPFPADTASAARPRIVRGRARCRESRALSGDLRVVGLRFPEDPLAQVLACDADPPRQLDFAYAMRVLV
jgi:hypothetical protein